MVHFSKFKLSGFKSFVDLTEVEIGFGLNGVVGPNGCGKSNLLEALRWVMGETSAKKMRGGGMEDVIFAGTAQRPPRSAAEVSLFLDNSDQNAPEPFKNVQDIQITRRIERDKGSQYKVNGKTVRARDVQMLFADTVSGANSPALVSQGKITTIINAKPHERRHVLEESAGVAGLYSRRHEAELRLRAAESNLARMDDAVQTSRTQLNSLRRQAGAAQKYKALSEKIRVLELLLIYKDYQSTKSNFEDKNALFQSLETQITQLMGDVTTRQKELDTVMATLPDQRKEDTKLQAQYQALRIEQNRLVQDRKSAQDALARSEDELSQLRNDLTETQEQIKETSIALAQLNDEEKEAQQRLENAPERLEAQKSDITSLQTQLDKLERQYQDQINDRARLKAQAEEAKAQLEEYESKSRKFASHVDEFKRDLEQLKSQKDGIGDLDEARAQLKQNQVLIDRLREKLDKALQAQEKCRSDQQTAQESLKTLETDKRILDGEIQTINNLLGHEELHDSDGKTSISSLISVAHGYEKALARALGDIGLQASIHAEDNVYWRHVSKYDLDDLSSSLRDEHDCTALSDYVEGPDALSLILGNVYVVDNSEALDRLIERLSVGEALVTKDGDYYRWDGLCIKSVAHVENAGQVLEYKNRLSLLIEQEIDLSQKIEEARQLYAQSAEVYEAACLEYDDAQSQLSEAEGQSKRLYRDLQDKETKLQQLNIRIEHATDRLLSAEQAYEDAYASLMDAKERIDLSAGCHSEADDEKLQNLSDRIASARETLNAKRSNYDVLSFQHKQDEERMQRVVKDRAVLIERCNKLKLRESNLVKRIDDSSAQVEKLSAVAKAAPQKDDELHQKLEQLEDACRQSADQLAVMEATRADASATLRETEQNLSLLKEKRASCQSEVANFKERLEYIRAQAQSQYQMSIVDLQQKVETAYEGQVPEGNSFQEELIGLKHKREAIGPVNLRAEIEASELEASMDELQVEYDDLTSAIEQLRKGIAKLNKEARERMRSAFLQVNAHFQKLFTRLFNGGSAYLELIESDDPLEAGLEIFAQPPGKSLQSLSLLSGGEQTMASIALIFAMFMTNPSPICVLDEIDAPLDDANVDRMCDLLEDIAKQGKTRFMVITHHRMTMARMDRLYGVTMSEKGVSKLVSVDLATQESFINELTA